jgi:hypothetical protein
MCYEDPDVKVMDLMQCSENHVLVGECHQEACGLGR